MIKVLNIKDIFKYLVKTIVILSITFGITRYFSYSYIKKENINLIKFEIDTSNIRNNLIANCMKDTLPLIKNKYVQSNIDETFIEKILNKELGMTKNIKIKAEDINNSNNVEIHVEEKIEEAKTNVETQIVDGGNVHTKYTNTYGSVQIRNESNKELTEEILSPNIQLNNLKDILIFHTHTCESYTQSDMYQYQATGNFRTTDLNFTVSRVGDELKKYLTNYGYNVSHNKTYHDYPAYTGSYGRSLITVKNDLSINPNTEIVFDIHRDAVGSTSEYAPTIKIGEEYVAQLMFVIGTDGGGLNHPNWEQNLKFAIKIQEKANEMYPGLFKPIILRNSRYNQHVTKGACIIEVGATGNTLEQSLISMKYLSKIISEVVK